MRKAGIMRQLANTLIAVCTGSIATNLAAYGADPPTLANPASTLKTMKDITAAYSRFDSAALARSVSGTLAIDTSGYQIVDAKGKVLYTNGPKMVALYKKTYEGATQVRQNSKMQKLSIANGTAKATILQRLQLSSIDPNINNWRTWVIDWKMEDTWINSKGTWKRKRTVMLEQTSKKHIGPVD